MKDYYKILGLNEQSSTNEVVQSFRLLAKKYHPDKNNSPGAPNSFREIYEAYEILKDEQKRLQYNRLWHAQNDVKPPQYSHTTNQGNYNQSTNNDQFSGWTQQAKENAKKYSNLKYKDFIKSALKGTAVFVITSVMEILAYIFSIVEFLSVIAIIGILISKGEKISANILAFNIVLALGFGFFYFYFIISSESKRIIFDLLINGKKALLKLAIYLSFVTYTIAIYWIAGITIKQKETEFHQEVSDIESHLYSFLQNYMNAENAISNFYRGIIVVDMNKRCLAEIFRSLPRSITTYRYDSVRTVIQIWETKTKVSKYTDGAFGYRQSLRYKIIDFRSSTSLAEDEIKGSDPPNSKKYSGDTSGSSPIPDFKELIINHVRD